MKKSKTIIITATAVLLLASCIHIAYALPEAKASDPIVPTVTLSPSNLGDSRLYNSWPLVMSLTIWKEESAAPDKAVEASPQPITVKTKGKSWQDALVIEIKDKTGTVVTWPLNLIADEKPDPTLSIGSSRDVFWTLSPEDTKAIPEGQYKVKITIDPKLLDEDISKKVKFESDDYYLKVSKEPTPLPDDIQTAKDLMMARYCFIKGDKKEAAAIIDKILAKDPECIMAYQVKASLLSLDGKNVEAISALDTAWDVYGKKYPDACAPFDLLNQRQEILSKIQLKIIPKEE